MMAIVLLLVLASGTFADEYTPVDWIQVVEGGGIEAKLGILNVGAYPGGGCISVSEMTVNNVTYSAGISKWQMRGEDSEWVDVEGTEREGEICGSLLPDMPGEFRWVVEIDIDGEIEKYASGNTLVVAGDPGAGDESAVQTVTWGVIKSRGARF